MTTLQKAKNIKKYLDSIRETNYDPNGVFWSNEIEYLQHVIKVIEFQTLNEPVPLVPIVGV